MIVEDKNKSITSADEIARKIFTYITTEIKDFKCDDDPAEHIYLLAHTIGNLSARICLLLEKYSEIYGIEKMKSENIQTWINKIQSEVIDFLKLK